MSSRDEELARAVIQDLRGRKGIRQAFDEIDSDVMEEIVSDIASILAAEPSPPRLKHESGGSDAAEPSLVELRGELGIVTVTSCANGELRVLPQWPKETPYTEEDGGGPGLFTRMNAAKQLENILNATALSGKEEASQSRQSDFGGAE